ncbi:MAG: flagellar biosynthesis protein FlhF [Woeseiaceae bacterium]|nr:flagellar biosynthesis protein FlhF [Woeseiaceae bacterium]
MKIKRYMDKDMRQVLRRVREDQGPDAVILSNRRVEDGIEVIAAIDYDEALVRHALGTAEDGAQVDSDALARIAEDDVVVAAGQDTATARADAAPQHPPVFADSLAEQRHAERADALALKTMHDELTSMRGMLETQLSGLAWREDERRHPARVQVLRNLARLGIAPDIANMIIDRIGSLEEMKSTWGAPLSMLAQTLPVVDDRLLETGGTIALIGPTGVGKTTTIAKIAARFAMNSWADDIALVSADAFRVGAREHLTAFANIIGAPVYAASSFGDLSDTLDKLKHKRLVLIDTEGRSQRDRDLAGRLAAYGRNAERVKFYLTLSAATQEAALDETIREFRQVPLEGCIVTKIDEAAQLGCVMSALIRNDLPAAWFSDGQRIPDDLHAAARKKLWLVNEAVECLESSKPIIDELVMAQNYASVNSAHAQ